MTAYCDFNKLIKTGETFGTVISGTIPTLPLQITIKETKSEVIISKDDFKKIMYFIGCGWEPRNS